MRPDVWRARRRSGISIPTAVLERLVKALEANQEQDPKFTIVQRQLTDAGWLELGGIVFSQYFDSIWWLTHPLTSNLHQQARIRSQGGRLHDPAESGACHPDYRDPPRRSEGLGDRVPTRPSASASYDISVHRLAALPPVSSRPPLRDCPCLRLVFIIDVRHTHSHRWWCSDRGLSPHQFTPMPGVHNGMQ